MRVEWDKTGERLYEAGTSHGVIYKRSPAGTYPMGEGWNGLRSFSSNPTGGEANAIYADDMKYLNLVSNEEFEGSIGAYMYPDMFADCCGEEEVAPGVTLHQQERKPFGFTCRTILGNDSLGNSYGYKLHLCYGLLATPSEMSYETVNEDLEPSEMDWDLTSTPEVFEGHKPVSYLTINSTRADPEKLAALEDVLYGTEGTDPRLPLPEEVYQILGSGVVVEANLSALTIGSLTLTPVFNKGTVAYTAQTTTATAAITATAEDDTAAVAILVNGNSIASGDTATFSEGNNTIAITVTNGESRKTYTVTVTYTA